MPVESEKKGPGAGGKPGQLPQVLSSDKRKSFGGEQFEKMVMHTGKMPSMIQPLPTAENLDNTQEQMSSSFFNGLMQQNTTNRQSFVYSQDEIHV